MTQEKEKRKETQYNQLLAAVAAKPTSPGSHGPKPNPKKGNKCNICQRTGYWVKSCPNKNKPPQTPCYKLRKQVIVPSFVPEVVGPLTIRTTHGP